MTRRRTQTNDKDMRLHAVLPVNLAGTRVAALMQAAADGNTHVVTGTFARLTLSNLRKGSSNYWCGLLAAQAPGWDWLSEGLPRRFSS